MSLLTPQTGNKTLDAAYVKMQTHVKSCKDFETFHQHFNYIVKTDDTEVLNKWLLKVLFVNMKYDNQEKHDFDKLLESVDETKRKELQNWLEVSLRKQGGN
jgi:predicted N-acyltransferase